MAKSCRVSIDGYRRRFARHFDLQSSKQVRVVHALMAKVRSTAFATGRHCNRFPFRCKASTSLPCALALACSTAVHALAST